MLDLPLEYLTSICEVKTIDNELVSTGIISQITDEYIEISGRTGISDDIGYESEVKMNIFNLKYGFRVLVGKIYIYNPEFLRLVEVVNILDYERRHFFRIDTTLPGEISYPSKDNPDNDDAMVKEHITIKNLSLGGALVRSSQEFKTGDKFQLRFRLMDRFGEFDCRVLRITEDKKERKLYGCTFHNCSSSLNDALCAYIFRLQREYIQKKNSIS